MTGFSKTLIVAAIPLTIYAYITFTAGIAPDWGISLLGAILCLGIAILWEHHVEVRRQQMADYGLWMASYRHDVWARRDREAGQ